MKMKRILLVLICALGFSSWAAAQGFIHPGGLHTQADFDRVKEKVEAGEEPWASAYKRLLASPHVNLNWTPNPTEKIIRGGRTPEEPDPDNYPNAYRDVATAYQCALVWKISGNEAYAKKSIQILNAWARTCKRITGNSNGCLATGIYGYQFANAAELMRDYEGWSKVDFERFQTWMVKVFCDGAFRFLEGRNGTRDDHYWSNWGLCNVLCAMSVGILCDDVFIYNRAMEYYKYMEDHRYGESLHHLVYQLFKDERGPFGYLGQMQESNRDQGHATMAAVMSSDICAIGYNQGEDAYRHMDDRIAAGLEYVAAYNVGVDDLPNTPYSNVDGTYNSMGTGGRGSSRPCWPRVVNYYENVRGVKVPYSRQMMMKDNNGVDAGGGSYGGNSGGYDHLGFTTLMCTLDPLEDKTCVPTALGGSLQYGDVVTTRTEVNNIDKGTTVKITVTLPEGEVNTGKWSWDDDPSCTTPEREVVLGTSTLYRVRYVNAKGVESSRMYSLHVEGEGCISAYTPYCKMDGVESADTMIYVKKNGSVILGLNGSSSNVREWKWERSSDGKTWSKMSGSSSRLTLSSVSSAYYYRVTMTHRSGAKVSQLFRVEVSEVNPHIIYNGTKVYDGTVLALEAGTSFSLYAEPNSVLGKSVNSTRYYDWIVGGDTLQSKVLTFHLDGSGNQVADLNDTLTVARMDTCFSCTLEFRRVSATGSEARTVYRFEVPVYEVNTLAPSDADDYYIKNAQGDLYLRNTDGLFVSYSEESDGNYLWRIRRLPSSYGKRYMFISRSNGSLHLSEEGKLVTTSDYSKHSFNLWHKLTDERLYAVQRSTSAGEGLLLLQADGSMAVSQEPCTEFPYMIVKKETADGVECVKAVGGTPERVMACCRQGDGLQVDVAERGILTVYTFAGMRVETVRLEAGRHTLERAMPGEGLILRYVTESGKIQSLKIL